jgi:hypothetical protein
MARGMRRCAKQDGTIAPDLIISAAYLFPKQTLERARFEAAVRSALSGAGALRSRYRQTHEGIIEYQEVEDFVPQLDIIRLDDTSPDDTAAVTRAAKEILDGESREAFDLTSGRLFSVVCVEGDESFAVIAKAVHVACDGASFEMVLEGIQDAYSATDFRVPVKAATLADVAHEEAVFHRCGRGEEVLAAWRARLPHGVPQMMVSHTKPWQERPLMGMARQELVTGDAYTAFISEAKRLRTTPFMLATAKFLFALRPSVVAGELSFVSPMPGRYVPSALEVVGYFSCPLPVLVEPEGEGPLDMLAAVQRGVLWTMENDGLTFADVIEATSPGQALEGEKRRTLFISGVPWRGFSLAGVAPQRIQPATTVRVLYDMSLWIEDLGTHIEVVANYSPQWMDDGQVQSWLQAIAGPLMGPP